MPLKTISCKLIFIVKRFEEEIGLPIPDVTPVMGAGPRVISASTYNEAQKQLAGIGPPIEGPQINGMGTLIPPPPPPVPFIPHQVRGTYSIVVFPKEISFKLFNVKK